MLGTKAYRYDDPRRMALYLLNNIIGGPGMNARLNLSLRERRGLVYTVESTMVCYSDTGLWSIYFGCDHHDVDRCLRLVRKELDRMMQKPLSARQLAAAKRQLKGQIAIACDNRSSLPSTSAKASCTTVKNATSTPSTAGSMPSLPRRYSKRPASCSPQTV